MVKLKLLFINEKVFGRTFNDKLWDAKILIKIIGYKCNISGE